jgi:alpha-galactosidase
MAPPWALAVLAAAGWLRAEGKLLLTESPPLGFNTFDSYGGLNHTDVLALADAMSSQLKPHGYEYLVLDGGWSAGAQCQTLPNGTKTAGECLDEYGQPFPDPLRFPDMQNTAAEVNKRGLKLGLWTIRGVYAAAVAAKAKIKGTAYTVDQLVDIENPGGGPNGSCLWAKNNLGINMSHPAAQTYYDNHVEQMVSYGIDFIKADCMMCGPCYTDEVMAFSAAVRKHPKPIALSYSPGGGNTVAAGRWVAGQATAPTDGGEGVTGPSTEPLGTMYRIVTDFHGGWYIPFYRVNFLACIDADRDSGLMPVFVG